MTQLGVTYLLLKIEKEIFDSLPIDALGHACFEPMVSVYQEGMRRRSGQEAHEFREEFYKSLTQGQRALFGFFSYYDHAIPSKDAFYRISCHYISQQIFGIVKKGAEYFKDNDMYQLLLKIEHVISADDQNEITNADLNELYKQLQEIAPRSLAIIGARLTLTTAKAEGFLVHGSQLPSAVLHELPKR